MHRNIFLLSMFLFASSKHNYEHPGKGISILARTFANASLIGPSRISPRNPRIKSAMNPTSVPRIQSKGPNSARKYVKMIFWYIILLNI